MRAKINGGRQLDLVGINWRDDTQLVIVGCIHAQWS